MTAPEPPRHPRPTLASIAYAAGLGVTTVSRALRNDPEIAADTRERVQLLARQVGYRPNRAGVRLRTGKTNVLTVVLNPGDDGSGFFSNFVFGIADAIAGTPYHLVVTPYSLSDPMAPIRYITETGSADGVIMSRMQPDDPRVRYLFEHKLPFACHGRTEMGIVHPYHDFDNAAFSRIAVQALASRGRKRLALLGPPPGLTYQKHTLQAFEQELRNQGLTGVPMGSIDADSPLGQVREEVRKVAQSESLDGIVCSAVRSAYPAAAGLTDTGKTIGRDVDIVTKHATDLLRILRPEVIAIPEDFREAGRDTARMLMAWIGGADPAQLQRVVVPEGPLAPF